MLNLQDLDLTPIEDLDKAKLIIGYCKKHNVTTYLETGAYLGKTVRQIIIASSTKRITVKDIYANELGKDLCARLLKEYERYEHVHIYEGDTVKKLPEMLQEVTDKSLFWLDAHYSGGDTVRGPIDCPILKELAIIAKHDIKEHVILIDDARTFASTNHKNWPSLRKIYNAIQKINKDYNITVINDIIVAEL